MTDANRPELDLEKCRLVFYSTQCEYLAPYQLRAALALLAEARKAMLLMKSWVGRKSGHNPTFREVITAYEDALASIPAGIEEVLK